MMHAQSRSVVRAWCAVVVLLAACGRTQLPPLPTPEAALAELGRDSSLPVRASFDGPTGGLSTLRGYFPASPVDRLTGARQFLARHATSLRLRADLGDLRLARERDSLGGATLRFEQLHGGVPVIQGGVLVTFDRAGAIVHLRSRYVPDLRLSTTPGLSATDARARAAAYLEVPLTPRSRVRLVVTRGDKAHPGHHLAWEVIGALGSPRGSWVVFVGAHTGEMLRARELTRWAGPGCVSCDPATDADCARVFFENPVDLADDPDLRDTDNVDGYQVGCTLQHLTSSTNLTGLYADTSITGERVGPPYDYLRSTADVGGGITGQQALDEMVVYYHATRAKQYLNEMGFTGVMSFPIPIDAHDASVGDNAYYDPTVVEMHFGEGGVDDGSDPDIVLHEYGHAMQDNQVPGWGDTNEGGAMGEGFGDYWAAAITEASAAEPDLGVACVGTWDATAWNPYTGAFGSGCLRRLDNTWYYPRDLRYEVHDDGEIWSAAIWDLRAILGGAVADKLVVESHEYQTPSATFINGADALLTADQTLFAGAYASDINATMTARGIPRTGTPASSAGLDQTASYSCESTHNYQNHEYQECTFTQPGAERLRFHFSGFNTETGYDFVFISDADLNQVQALHGKPFGGGNQGNPGYSAAVSGDTIVARFKADYTVTKWGFAIDQVEYVVATCSTDPDCDDGNPCTVNTCNAGTCTTTNQPSGTSCADGDLCNGDETCDGAGTCQPGAALSCDDANPCTADSCSATLGCQNPPEPAGTSCADATVCNGDETCDGVGTCQPGTPLNCDDANPCTVDSCDAALGCQNPPAAAGTPCPDDTLCNGDETCDGAGACQAGTPPVCDDGNPCTADSCTPHGGCTYVATNERGACDDGDPCTESDQCRGGLCTGRAKSCDDSNACTADSCNGATGLCEHTPTNEGGSCTDWNNCTVGDQCASGVCAGTAMDCDDGNPCTVGACKPSTGRCEQQATNEGGACSDGNECTGTDTCQSGLCSGPPLPAGTGCTGGTCDGAGACTP